MRNIYKDYIRLIMYNRIITLIITYPIEKWEISIPMNNEVIITKPLDE